MPRPSYSKVREAASHGSGGQRQRHRVQIVFKKCDRSTIVPTRTRAARRPPVSIRATAPSVATVPWHFGTGATAGRSRSRSGTRGTPPAGAWTTAADRCLLSYRTYVQGVLGHKTLAQAD